MGLIEVSERTSPQRAAAIKARLYGTPSRKVSPKPEPEPVEQPKPVVIYKMVRPVIPTGPVQHNAHVSDWYKHECDRLGKQVSELEFKLGAYNDNGGQRVYLDEIIAKMCEHYGVSKLDIKSERRTRDLVRLRHKMIWVVKKLTPLSYPQIGRHFGGRDHSTILNAVSRIDALIASNDPSVADLKGWIND